MVLGALLYDYTGRFQPTSDRKLVGPNPTPHAEAARVPLRAGREGQRSLRLHPAVCRVGIHIYIHPTRIYSKSVSVVASPGSRGHYI